MFTAFLKSCQGSKVSLSDVTFSAVKVLHLLQVKECFRAAKDQHMSVHDLVMVVVAVGMMLVVTQKRVSPLPSGYLKRVMNTALHTFNFWQYRILLS